MKLIKGIWSQLDELSIITTKALSLEIESGQTKFIGEIKQGLKQLLQFLEEKFPPEKLTTLKEFDKIPITPGQDFVE